MPPRLVAPARSALAALRRGVAESRIRLGQRGVTLTPHPVSRRASRDAAGDERSPSFDAGRAFAMLEAQVAHGPRIPGTPGHARTLALIVDTLASCADELATQTWRQRIHRGPGRGRTFAMTNVLARFEGEDDHRHAPSGDEPAALMLSTHWDTRPVADHDPDPTRRGEPVPGASDGASGVAVLLELARGLAARRPRHTVVLAFWDGEDLGEYYYGSRLFARVARGAAYRRWRARCGVVVDMIGGAALRCTTELRSVRAAPALWAHVHRCAADVGLAHHFHGAPGLITDDHVFLDRGGIPTVLLIDYAYPHWHTTDDVPARCSADSLGVIGRVLERVVAVDPPTAPREPSPAPPSGAPALAAVDGTR